MRFSPAALVVLACVAAGCRESPAGSAGPVLSLEVTGRLERGSVLHVRVLQEGIVLDAGAAVLAFAPAGAAQPLGGDSVRLLRSGAVTVRATAGGGEGVLSLDVAVPPTIVFDRVVGGNRDLWRVELDGGGLARLTDDPAEDRDPTVAGGRIVFVSPRADGNAELFGMPTGGGAATRLTRTAFSEAAPALSRDGQRLAYTSDVSGLPRLWVAAGDGTGAVRAAGSPGSSMAVDASPSWAPDGSRLAFASTLGGTADIFSLAPSGTPALLAGGGSAEVDPAYSPDGQFLAFSSTRAGGALAHLYLLRVTDGTVTRLTHSAASAGQPTWTADGRLVYTEFGPGGGQLRWMDPAQPAVVHAIPTGPESARNPAAVL